MYKIKTIITGNKVHDVGYRILLVNKALSLGLNNFNTFNTNLNRTQAVIAIMEADEEAIEDFKNFITNNIPNKSIVENISFEEYKNTVPPIERVMQSFQMEQWGKGIPILLHMSETLEQNTSILKENTSILKKNTSILYDFKTESNNNFNDLKDIMSKHDIDASERILLIKDEILQIKERLSSVESAVLAL
ncbi:MAG: acylphosphatase [Methanosarcinales archaeon]|nr:acylphosphatase [Methanosarcinales archaeon]